MFDWFDVLKYQTIWNKQNI